MERCSAHAGAEQPEYERLETGAGKFTGFRRPDAEKEAEKQGFTLSYIKTVTWQAERLLNQATPLEYLLTQYRDARARKQNTEALEKRSMNGWTAC